MNDSKPWVGGVSVEDIGIPLSEMVEGEVLKQKKTSSDVADEIAEVLTQSMIRLSNDEERRKQIGKMLV